jgi:hypothetical protein
MTEIKKNDLSYQIHLIYSSSLSDPIEIELRANADELRKLADRLNLKSIRKLTSSVLLMNVEPGVFKVTGILDSNLVVSDSDNGESLEFSVNDPFEELFAFSEFFNETVDRDKNKQFDFELIENNIIDLGELVSQNLSLALEPLFINSYGVAEESVVFSDDFDNEKEISNPFSVLRDWKGNLKQ